MGCASGKHGGPRNIFGNKYGQNLAAVQIAREARAKAKREAAAATQAQAVIDAAREQANNNDDDDMINY